MDPRDLVRAAVERTREFSLREGGRLLGVSHSHLSLWRAWVDATAAGREVKDIPDPSPATLRGLRNYLQSADDIGDQRRALGLAADRLEGLVRQLRDEAAAGQVQARRADPSGEPGAFTDLVTLAESLREADGADEPPLRWLGLAKAVADRLVATGRVTPTDGELRNWQAYIVAASGRRSIPEPTAAEVERISRMDRRMFGNDIELTDAG